MKGSMSYGDQGAMRRSPIPYGGSYRATADRRSIQP
jgi:hypothetical protein